MFDEAHSAHVSREVVDPCGTTDGSLTGLLLLQIHLQVIDARRHLVPVGQRLDIHGADAVVSLSHEGRDQMASDEPPGAAHDD